MGLKLSLTFQICGRFIIHVAGGSGITAQLWKFVFQPKGLIQAAIDLLECCSSCSDNQGYDGGCPACIQAGECIKFNDFLSKSSALIIIGKNLLKRMEQTEVYKLNKNENDAVGNNEEKKHAATYIASPRTIKRERILSNDKWLLVVPAGQWIVPMVLHSTNKKDERLNEKTKKPETRISLATMQDLKKRICCWCSI
jgi:hypothetical protein